VAAATASGRRLRAERDAVEADAERLARVTAELTGLHETLATREAESREWEARLAEVERLAAASRERKGAHDIALARAAEARAAADARRALAGGLADAVRERDALAAADADDAERLAALAGALDAATVRLAEARRGRDAAARTLAARRADGDAIRDRRELAELQGRKARLDRLAEEGRVAQAEVETNPVTDDLLRAIEEASQEAALARARLEGGAGEVAITALAAVQALVNGASVPLAAGVTEVRPIGDGVAVEIPGVARVVARPGTSAAGLRQDLVTAADALVAACAAAGVADVAEARSCNAERRAGEDAVRRARQEYAAILDGARPADVEQRIVTLATRVAEHDAVGGHAVGRERPEGLALPGDAAEADALVEAAQAADRAAATAVAIAEQAETAARAAADAGRAGSEERRVAMGIAAGRAAELEATLTAARAEIADDVLAARLAEADRAAAAAAADRLAAETALAAANPDQARLLARNAKDVLETTRARQAGLAVEQARLAGSLERIGDAGLGEQLDAAEADLEHAEDALRRLRRRAGAARTLYDALKGRRDAARRRYVEPLEERLEALGRCVFGPDVVIDVADDLTIASLARGGVPIGWDQLSVGTREQLGVLVRLACAELVAADGGVPIMLDDALGWSDPERLETMGAVLARAGQTSQVIVLTCFPDRYAHVGGATVIRLG
jgi:hypothetical protein